MVFDEWGRLSLVTLIQLGAIKIVEAPKIVDLALDEKPTSELTVDHVQIFWMKVAQGCFHRTHCENRRCTPGVTIFARYGKRVVKNENTEQTTGFASMIIRVPQENLIPLLIRKGRTLREANTESKPRADADGTSGS